MVLVAAAAMVWIWTWPLTVDQRLLVIGDLAAIATVVLATIAALVALAAYAAATGPPDLRLEMSNPFSERPNELLMKLQPPRDGLDYVAIDPFKQVQVSVKVTNRSHWSARNPAVRIDLSASPVSAPSRAGLQSSTRRR
jgi:hypothetical protein